MAKLSITATLLLAIWWPGAALLAQQPATTPEGCGTHLPATGPALQALEAFQLRHLHQPLRKTATEPDTFIIPCVVHVVYNTAQPPITVEDVERYFHFMHEDYRNLPGSRAWGATADRHITFQLATKDPQGNPHSGVVFVQNALTSINADYASSDPAGDNFKLKTLSRWDSTQYCNIWVVNTIQSAAGPLAGYAQYPWDNRPPTDGIVVKFSNFAIPTYNFTATHELGHWLGLIHPFDSLNCSMGDCLNIGDKVCDTPTSNSVFKYDPVRYNHCTNEVAPGGENPRNYMDYHANSSLPNEFTPGQMARCLTALQDAALDRRYNLYRAANLEATGCGAWGRVRAYFWAPLQRVTVGQSLRFQEYCMGQPHSYRWEFEGGTPATSTAPNPTVSWAAPGTYSVKLVVENLSGRKDSLLREDFITVAGAPVSLPLGQDFSSTTFPPAGWQLISQDVTSVVQPSWQHRPDVGAYGFNDGCIELPFHQNQNRNTTDWLVLPPATLPSEYAALSFEVAYSPLRIAEDAPNTFPGAGLQLVHTFTDTLAVEVSVDGGSTWQTAWQKGGEALMTTASVNTTVSAAADYVFVPGDEDWRTEIADLRPWAGQQAIVRLAGKNGYGNFLYLDDLSLGENPQVGRRNAQPLAGVRAYPNPATQQLTVQLAQPLLQPATVQLTDALGHQSAQQLLPAGDTRLQLNLQALPAGLYVLQVDTATQQKRLRIVKQ